MMSNEEHQCDIFLMDSSTLQPIVLARFEAVESKKTGHSVFATLTLFDPVTFLWLMTSFLIFSKPANLPTKEDFNRHRLYRRMILCSSF